MNSEQFNFLVKAGRSSFKIENKNGNELSYLIQTSLARAGAYRVKGQYYLEPINFEQFKNKLNSYQMFEYNNIVHQADQLTLHDDELTQEEINSLIEQMEDMDIQRTNLQTRIGGGQHSRDRLTSVGQQITDFLLREGINDISFELKIKETVRPPVRDTVQPPVRDTVQPIENCSICLEPLTSDILITKCFHRYHKKCIRQMQTRSNNNNCPICRTPL